MTTPRSSRSSATAGVGTTPPSTACPPAATTPRANACSSSGPDARVSRPMKTRASSPTHSVDAFPRRSTSSGVMNSPTTPRTPSVPKYFLAKALEAQLLALGELRRFAGLVQPGLLALDLAGVACQEALTLQRDPQLRIGLDERACDAVARCACLAGWSAAVHADPKVERPLDACDLERREHHLAM